MPNTTSPVATLQSIGRDSASKLNPLIAMSSPETFDRCRVIVRDLGYIMSAGEHLDMPPDMSNWYQMFEAVSAAMAWEIEAMEIERDRQEVEAENNPDSIRSAIKALDKGIAILSRQPESDKAATVDMIHATTRRAALRAKLAELESRSAIDGLDEIISSFLRSADADKSEAIVHAWAESGGLRDMLVALESGVTK
jgi:hypothetical protein